MLRQNQRIIAFDGRDPPLAFVADLFKSRRRLEAEILCLRHQLKYRIEATTATSAAAGQRSCAAGVDDPALAEPARCLKEAVIGGDVIFTA